jgi:hypothetical protein
VSWSRRSDRLARAAPYESAPHVNENGPSTRPGDRTHRGLSELDYPLHDWAATVTTCGRICFSGRKVNLYLLIRSAFWSAPPPPFSLVSSCRWGWQSAHARRLPPRPCSRRSMNARKPRATASLLDLGENTGRNCVAGCSGRHSQLPGQRGVTGKPRNRRQDKQLPAKSLERLSEACIQVSDRMSAFGWQSRSSTSSETRAPRMRRHASWTVRRLGFETC